MEGLSPNQVKFKNNIIKGMRPRAAYIKAGYKARGGSADAAASRLLKDVKIQAAVNKSKEKINEKVEKKLSFDLIDVKEELWAVASSSMKDYYGKNGELLPPHKLSDKAAKAVSSFEVEESRRGGGKLKKEKGAILKKVKLHNKTDAGKDLRRSFEGDKVKITYDLDDWEEYMAVLSPQSKALFIKRMEERKRKRR